MMMAGIHFIKSMFLVFYWLSDSMLGVECSVLNYLEVCLFGYVYDEIKLLVTDQIIWKL